MDISSTSRRWRIIEQCRQVVQFANECYDDEDTFTDKFLDQICALSDLCSVEIRELEEEIEEEERRRNENSGWPWTERN